VRELTKDGVNSSVAETTADCGASRPRNLAFWKTWAAGESGGSRHCRLGRAPTLLLRAASGPRIRPGFWCPQMRTTRCGSSQIESSHMRTSLLFHRFGS